MNKKLLFKNKYRDLLFKSRYLKEYGISYGLDVNNFYPNVLKEPISDEEIKKIKYDMNIKFKRSCKWRMLKKEKL